MTSACPADTPVIVAASWPLATTLAIAGSLESHIRAAAPSRSVLAWIVVVSPIASSTVSGLTESEPVAELAAAQPYTAVNKDRTSTARAARSAGSATTIRMAGHPTRIEWRPRLDRVSAPMQLG